jgi:hypothetical protein
MLVHPIFRLSWGKPTAVSLALACTAVGWTRRAANAQAPVQPVTGQASMGVAAAAAAAAAASSCTGQTSAAMAHQTTLFVVGMR